MDDSLSKLFNDFDRGTISRRRLLHALGLARAVHTPGGPQWFYEGVTLGYRTLYVWYPAENLMITVQTNSQPPQGADKIGEAVRAIHDIVKGDQPKASP